MRPSIVVCWTRLCVVTVITVFVVLVVINYGEMGLVTQGYWPSSYIHGHSWPCLEMRRDGFRVFVRSLMLSV